MYSEFDDVSIFGTSNPPVSQSAGTLLNSFQRNPYPSELGTPDEFENTHKLAAAAAAAAMEQQEEDSAIPPPSSSCSSENQIHNEEKQVEAAAAKDDDDGYQTPASPRRRIPPAIKCPPAPKKPKMLRRWHCIRIKAGTGLVRRRIDTGSALFPDSDDLSTRKKKAREDATAYR